MQIVLALVSFNGVLLRALNYPAFRFYAFSDGMLRPNRMNKQISITAFLIYVRHEDFSLIFEAKRMSILRDILYQDRHGPPALIRKQSAF